MVGVYLSLSSLSLKEEGSSVISQQANSASVGLIHLIHLVVGLHDLIYLVVSIRILFSVLFSPDIGNSQYVFFVQYTLL